MNTSGAVVTLLWFWRKCSLLTFNKQTIMKAEFKAWLLTATKEVDVIISELMKQMHCFQALWAAATLSPINGL